MNFKRVGWLVLVLAASGCATKDAPEVDRPDERSVEEQAAEYEPGLAAEDADEGLARATSLADLVRGNQNFAFDFHKSAASPDTVYSPHAISMALGPLDAGARGVSSEQIRQVMHFEAVDEGQLHSKFRDLSKELEARGLEPDQGERGVRLKFITSFWVDEALEVSRSFQSTLEDHYATSPQKVSFGDGGAAAINRLVTDSTAGRVEGLVDAVSARAGLLVTSTAQFNGAWAMPFSKSLTQDGDFESEDATLRVPYMRQVNRLGYLNGDGYQVVELPYSGGAVSAYVVLPEQGRYDEIDRSLTADKFNWVRQTMRQRPVEVMLPKFQMSSRIALKERLRGMGIEAAFAEDQGLAEVTGEAQALEDIFHEVRFGMDEAGTESAPAVGMGSAGPVGSMGATHDFHATRPFTVLLVDNPTGAILVVARVTNPTP